MAEISRAAKLKALRLPEKLVAIRKGLGLSQGQIAFQLAAGDQSLSKYLAREKISGFELGNTEPPLPVLLRYAQIAGVIVDLLINDEVDLPDPLPNAPAPPFASDRP